MLVPRHLAAALLVAFASFGLSQLGLLVVDPDTQVAFLWPASAASFLALALSDRRRWPLLLIAIAVGNAAAELGTREGALLHLAIVAANTLEPLVAVTLYRALSGADRFRLDTPAAVLAFLAGATAGATAAAILAAATLALTLGVPFGSATAHWLLADLTGITAAAPVALFTSAAVRPRVPRIEVVAIIAASVAATLLIFWRGTEHITPLGSYPFLLTPLMLWAALRLRQAATGGLLLTCSVLAAAGTLTGHGAFARAEMSADHRVLGFQAFATGLTFCVLFASAVTMELHRTAGRLAGERARLRSALAHHELVVQHLPEVVIGLYDRDLRCQLLEGGALAGSKYADPAAWRGRIVTELFPVEDLGTVALAFSEALDQRTTSFDWRSPHTQKLFEMQVLPALSPTGEVDHLVCVGRDVTALRAQQRELRDLADRDSLTGACNRRSFSAIAGAHLEATRASGTFAGGVAVIDLDRFKPVNDEHGHAVGDEVLRAVVTEVTAVIGADDTVARIGGDEFAILLPTLDRADAPRIAADLDEAIRRIRVAAPGAVVQASASVGIAMRADHPSADAAQWVSAADAAMYAAKRERQQFSRIAA